MILDADHDVVLLGGGDVGLHLLGENLHGSPQLHAGEALGPAAPRDEQLSAKLAGKPHLVLQPERSEVVASHDTQFHPVLVEKAAKRFAAHLLDLLALVSVHARPDVNVFGSDLGHFRKNLLQRRRAIHAG